MVPYLSVQTPLEQELLLFSFSEIWNMSELEVS